MAKESFNDPKEIPAQNSESRDKALPQKKILSGKVGAIARNVALLGTLAVGAEAVVPSSAASMEKTHQLTVENTVDREEARRDKEITSWLTELGYASVHVQHDRRGSGMFNEREMYHIEITLDGKKISFGVGSEGGPLQKDAVQKIAKQKIEEHIQKPPEIPGNTAPGEMDPERASFVKHIKVDPDAREVMTKIGAELQGVNLIYDRATRTGVSLYSSGENQSVRIRKQGPRSLELIITEKNGKVLHYEITSGHLEPMEK